MSDSTIVLWGIWFSLFVAYELHWHSIDLIELEAHRLKLTGLKFKAWVKWRSGEL